MIESFLDSLVSYVIHVCVLFLKGVLKLVLSQEKLDGLT